MKTKNKGIKRHESLYPLSHHHHHALFLALNLRKVGTDKSNYTLDELKEELRVFWEDGGQQHFRDEEEILLPNFALYSSTNHPEIAEMLLEHVSIRAIMKQILDKNEADEAVMYELGQLLDTHIRREERVIFPMIEEALPEEVLVNMAPYLHND
ncbi:hemerythrin domain-containing protein [Aquibacillus koreensis]|uniref:Hemerythrin domain-containing protein n=1 Tax=Aquibacillus koreensis TaxID=279446 RepID=A0A9X4AJA8_9BACI|nr:hemerythrin domain-containing protein [Aquibacillus koreensis]MCT2536122.1 hemerythrin domain-containing protein [Aquibacillus koreensis]MDC3422047.1 hemerythrin domain-containing protein [Aquibacillus koreensis]